MREEPGSPQGIQRMDDRQWTQTKTQEGTLKHKKKLVYGEEGQALDQVPQRLRKLHFWMYSNLIIHINDKLLWLTLLGQGVGLDDLKRSLVFPASV